MFELLANALSVKFKHADFMGETMASYYIRLCYFNFVKIYSYISNSEIVKINQKVVKRLNDRTLPRDSAHLVVDIDPFGVHGSSQKGFKKQVKIQQEVGGRKKHSFPILLSKLYLKVVLNVALNRNEAAKSIFYQFRIMEFFYKEIDLEFEINQIKERFHKVRNNAKERVSRAASPKKAFEERSEESDNDSNEINIYRQSSKARKKDINSSPVKETGYVPKLNFNNLTSGDNPLKISSKNTHESPMPSQSKTSGLDFVDRGALPGAAKFGGLKLNINLPKLGQKVKDPNEPVKPSVLAGPGKFNLDFSKLAPKVNPGAGEEKKPMGQPMIPALSLGNSEPQVQKPTLGIPALGGAGLGGKPTLGGIGKLNLANIERGTPVEVPDLPASYIDDSSDSSTSVQINFEEVEKAKRALQVAEDFSGQEENHSSGNEISLESISQEQDSKPAFKSPIMGKLQIPIREGGVLPPTIPPLDDQEDPAEFSGNFGNSSSSSSVIGFMPPPSMGMTNPGAFGIGKRSYILRSEFDWTRTQEKRSRNRPWRTGPG